MKKQIGSVVIIIALLGVGSASAEIWEGITPYVGIDYKNIWPKVKGLVWKPLLPRSFPGATIYIGTQFCDTYLSTEFGYSMTANKRRNGIFNGIKIPLSEKINSIYLDLVGTIPIICGWDVFGVLGLAHMKTKITVQERELRTKTKQPIFRIGFGANYMFNDCIGARLKLLWENSSRLRITDRRFESNAFELSRKPYRLSTSLSFGAFFKF